MSVITYKCPRCDAELIFRPKTGDFGCEYCGAAYTEAQLQEIAQKQGINQQEEAQKPEPAPAELEHTVVFSCPSCGAEVVTDDTTAATFCFYCHNPVIMKGRLSGAFKPDQVIPFSVSKDEVKGRLLKWCKKKKFIKEDFCSEMQMEKLSGVYFPFWVVDADSHVQYSAEGTVLRVWRVGDIEYTETSKYALEREGDVDLNEITVKAISRDDVKLLAGLYPYDMSARKEFNMGYLSGFLAEKRNVEKAAATPEVKGIIQNASECMIRDTTSGYGTVVTKRLHVADKKQDWKYLLMPAWTMTYQYRGEMFYFAMNGQTGQVAGRVPVSGKKLLWLFLGLFAAVTLIGLAVGWFV